MLSTHNSKINSREFDGVVKKLRAFFDSKGFTEVHTQNRLSILCACEDPTTISLFSYAGSTWPLPQTGQMWLEHELLRDPSLKGVYTLSTSYRNEPKPVEGRHDLIFPMFEFETHGGMDVLLDLEKELLEHLGYGKKDSFPEGDYEDIAKKYETKELTHEHEARLLKEYGNVFFLKNFPKYTSPFWNMKKGDKVYNKIDVIMSGMETIGSAERSADVKEMKDDFLTISDGKYSGLLYSLFTKERVNKELDEFLDLKFIPRCGGGIGVTRLIKSMKSLKLL